MDNSQIAHIRILQANCWKSREQVTMHLFGEKELHELDALPRMPCNDELSASAMVVTGPGCR